MERMKRLEIHSAINSARGRWSERTNNVVMGDLNGQLVNKNVRIEEYADTLK